MTHIMLIAGVLLPLLTEGPLSAAESTPQPSVFPDKKLEAIVRKYVFDKRDTDKPLVEADVANISTIEGKGGGVTDLTGLEKCVSLASLDLGKNKIKQIGALKELTRLQYLNLMENRIEDISTLSNIVALQYIELSHNRVRELEPLRGLTNLAALYLSDNQISDLTPILSLPKLTSLYVDENCVKSIEGVSHLKRLATLSLKNDSICDLSPLKGLQGLTWLFLESNKIRDLTPLVEMAKADKEQRFAPFWNIYLDGNPLNPATTNQISALKEIGVRLHESTSPPASTVSKTDEKEAKSSH